MMILQSDDVTKIAPAFLEAQAELKDGKRGGKNPHFNSKFMRLEDVWAASEDVLHKADIMVIQSAVTIDGRPHLVCTLMHTSGEFFRGYFELITEKNTPQAMGSAIRYMRRYSLSSMIGLIEEEDDDAEGAMDHEYTTPAAAVEKVKTDDPIRDEAITLRKQIEPDALKSITEGWRLKHNITEPGTATDAQMKDLIKRYKAEIKEQSMREAT